MSGVTTSSLSLAWSLRTWVILDYQESFGFNLIIRNVFLKVRNYIWSSSIWIRIEIINAIKEFSFGSSRFIPVTQPLLFAFNQFSLVESSKENANSWCSHILDSQVSKVWYPIDESSIIVSPEVVYRIIMS